MTTTTRPIPGTFAKVPGGYSRRVDARTTVFIPDCAAACFDAETGTLYGVAPDYAAIEAAKAPAEIATVPGEYIYQYETEHAPQGCDFSASLSHYGKHYFLHPLRADLPQLHGRGITPEKEWDEIVEFEKNRKKGKDGKPHE